MKAGESRRVEATIGPTQSGWLDYIRQRTSAATDEEALRIAIQVAHTVLNPDELRKVIGEALRGDRNKI